MAYFMGKTYYANSPPGWGGDQGTYDSSTKSYSQNKDFLIASLHAEGQLAAAWEQACYGIVPPVPLPTSTSSIGAVILIAGGIAAFLLLRKSRK